MAMQGVSSPQANNSKQRRPRHSHSLSDVFSFGPQSLVSSSLSASPTVTRHLDPNASMLHASPRLSNKKTNLSQSFSVEGNETQSFADGDGELDWGPVDRMRLWRHDALMQHLYGTAAFWGEKILSWTRDPNDAFWLAQTYFLSHQFSRTEHLLTQPFHPGNGSVFPPRSEGSQSAQASSLKGKGREPDEEDTRLVDMSVTCRYLAAQCQVSQGKWHEAIEMLGDSNPFRGTTRSGPSFPNSDGGLKVEASMCHLRGLLMLKLNRSAAAKESFMEALALDVKCYDAFEMLVGGEMMTIDEEWNFIQTLSYKSHAPEEAEFVRLMYTTRLKKYKHHEEHRIARKKLAEGYALLNNADVLHGFADMLYSQFRWKDCYSITMRILEINSMHTPSLPLHIACMYHQPRLHSSLFILAHESVEQEPDNAITWYAVGMWYFTGKKWSEARKYFSKTSLMDPRFAPAWIAFGHTFAAEGEHDHAITAYSTSARLFQGSHLPLLFVGMEHLQLANELMAEEALAASLLMCDSDPLVWNEQGVLNVMRKDYARAVDLFRRTLELAQLEQGPQIVWIATRVNLGTSYRRLGKLEEAKEEYRKILSMEPRHANALSLLGVVYQLQNKTDEAIQLYHEALSIDNQNPYILELLNVALESAAGILPVVVTETDGKWLGKVREMRAGDIRLGLGNVSLNGVTSVEDMNVDTSS